MRKFINVERRKAHGNFLNSTSSHNTFPFKKNNPSKMHSLKKKTGNFEASVFNHFKDDTMKNGFNNCALENGRRDDVSSVNMLTP